MVLFDPFVCFAGLGTLEHVYEDQVNARMAAMATAGICLSCSFERCFLCLGEEGRYPQYLYNDLVELCFLVIDGPEAFAAQYLDLRFADPDRACPAPGSLSLFIPENRFPGHCLRL